MSVTSHHAEWLSLIEVSGPFLSMPVLMRVFPQGLDPREPEKAKELHLAYEEWLQKPNEPGRHQAWIRFVLTRFLEFPESLVLERQSIPYGIEAYMAEYGERLRPDYAIVAPPGHVAAGKPHLLQQVYPPGQNLDGPVAGKHWKASPATRMTELLHAADIPLGMITNGEQWMLVYAPRGETSGYASWYSGLWQEEPITLRAYSSTLHARRFFGVAESDTLTALLSESAKDQQEVTDQLGLQVRQAVEVLVQAFDRLDQESGRLLLYGISPNELYDAALTVMMRLVFLFSAEERGMLRLGEPLYDENYAASTLREQLREAADQHGEEVLERRSDAWSRLMATFRAVYGGISHETLRLPAYGGTLFDPDRYPFLESRPVGTEWRLSSAEPLAVNNRVVLHLLESLQLLQMKIPGGGRAEARRLSFRALDIEQIGHVYEGLLDHTAVRANTTILGLQGAKNNEPEISLEKLEQLRADGENRLIEYLNEETKRSEPALRRALAEKDQITINDHRLLITCGHDVQLRDRIKTFAEILRMDSFEMPVVIIPGSVYVTKGTTRRSTGTHYTPKSLTEPIVQHTLEPLVYEGPAEGWPKEKWKLKSPKEILALRLCDMTMGSGAFLVQSCRYLAERLAEAWENTEQNSPGSFVVTPDGELSTGDPTERLLPKDQDERLVIARRAVADRCLFGVDINPMAVEMAKLSLWLVTMQKDRPFTFLDHALKCGDSLLGVISLEQIANFSLRPEVKQITFATANLFQYVEEAANKRRQLETLPSESSLLDAKIHLHDEAETAITTVKASADLIIALELQGLKGKAYEEARTREAEKVQWLIQQDANETSKDQVKNAKQVSALASYAKEKLGGRPTFHWLLEYPEIFERGAFDAFVGNPPFMGGLRISEELGDDYNEYLMSVYELTSKKADICACFFQRADQLTVKESCVGLLATNTISQGVTRRSSLDVLVAKGASIYRAIKSFLWPGQAAVIAALVIFKKGRWEGLCDCDDLQCDRIGVLLEPERHSFGQPIRLILNKHTCYQGVTMWGDEFFLPEELAANFLKSSRNSCIVKTAMGGKELNNSPELMPERWAINFGEMDEEEARKYPDVFIYLQGLLKDKRSNLDHEKYGRIVFQWWKYFHSRSDLFTGIKERHLSQVMARSRVSDMHMLGFLGTDIIYTDALVLFLFDNFEVFGLLQSSIHDIWVRKYASTLKNDVRYVVTDCFETFPFPQHLDNLLKTSKQYYDLRCQLMSKRQEGLTKIYNRFHSKIEAADDINRLRSLHTEMDKAVITSYGWTDLDLGHGLHETKQGIRFTISEPARKIVLDRLLALNHERYEEEVKAGLHEKKVAKGTGKGRKKKSLSDKEENQYKIFEE